MGNLFCYCWVLCPFIVGPLNLDYVVRTTSFGRKRERERDDEEEENKVRVTVSSINLINHWLSRAGNMQHLLDTL